MNEQERIKLCKEIVKKVQEGGRKIGRRLSKDDKLNLTMDLFYARSDEFNKGKDDLLVPGDLDLKALSGFDEFSLFHDVFGIDTHIVKDSSREDFGTMTNCFVPRCGFMKEVA